jgi:hypothetical protein
MEIDMGSRFKIANLKFPLIPYLCRPLNFE